MASRSAVRRGEGLELGEVRGLRFEGCERRFSIGLQLTAASADDATDRS
jgi:hypothetical protein